MSIKGSVGAGAVNDKVDVKVIQAALNIIEVKDFKLAVKLVIDGNIGKKTISAITDFQKKILKLNNPDGRVDPGGRTLIALSKHIKKGINIHSLMAIMAYGRSDVVSRYLLLLKPGLAKYQIYSSLRAAHFLAQIGHESLSFQYSEEVASGAAYEGRKDLGNVNVGDGVRFKGRGLIQLTGRSNYEAYGKYINMDLLIKGKEKIVADDTYYALDVSLWFWRSRKLNSKADADNLRSITRSINGGYNGLDDRRDYLNRAKFFLVM